jgi:hypothetical protein
MPFLFVDYDQGAGGEYFSAELSRSPQCVTLESVRYANGRTKVQDLFGQKFLDLTLDPWIDPIDAHPTLYDVVPCHRNTDRAKKLLKDVRSIRIKTPVDPALLKHLKDHQINKVWLAVESPEYFVGELRLQTARAVDKALVKQIKSTMRRVDIALILAGQEPTESAVNKYIEEIRNLTVPEPNIDYDLVIPYEDLFYNVNQVKHSIKAVFGIDIETDWLDRFKATYDAQNTTS